MVCGTHLKTQKKKVLLNHFLCLIGLVKEGDVSKLFGFNGL